MDEAREGLGVNGFGVEFLFFLSFFFLRSPFRLCLFLCSARLAKMAILAGFWWVNVSIFEQNQQKPEKTCGNRRNQVDNLRRKAEGELRYGSPHPHEHW